MINRKCHFSQLPFNEHDNKLIEFVYSPVSPSMVCKCLIYCYCLPSLTRCLNYSSLG